MGNGILSRKQSGRAVKLNTHLHLVPRIGISGAKFILPRMLTWLGLGKYLLLLFMINFKCILAYWLLVVILPVSPHINKRSERLTQAVYE